MDSRIHDKRITREVNRLGRADVVPAARLASIGFARGVFRERHRKRYRFLNAGSIPAQTTKGSSMAEHAADDRGVTGSNPVPTERLRSRTEKQVVGVIQRLAGRRMRGLGVCKTPSRYEVRIVSRRRHARSQAVKWIPTCLSVDTFLGACSHGHRARSRRLRAGLKLGSASSVGLIVGITLQLVVLRIVVPCRAIAIGKWQIRNVRRKDVIKPC